MAASRLEWKVAWSRRMYKNTHASPCSSCRTNDFQFWKVRPVARHVASQQRQPMNGRVGAYKEVGQRRPTLALCASILQEALSSEKAGLPGHFHVDEI